MPLIQSARNKSIGENIRREKEAGKPYRQALAIALSVQDRNRLASGGAPQVNNYQTPGTPNINSAGYVNVPQTGSFNLDLGTGALTPSTNNTISNIAQRGLPISGVIQSGAYPQSFTRPAPPPPSTPAPAPSSIAGMSGFGGFGGMGALTPDQQAQAAAIINFDTQSSMGGGGTRYGGAVRRAGGGMVMPPTPWWTRSEARGEEHVPTGLIHGLTGGRADKVSMNLAPNSHVIPADVVSGWGQGNTNAGAANLEHALRTGPFGVALPKPASRGPSSFRMPPAPRMARGGVPPEHGGIRTLVSDGELIIPPSDVFKIGNGDHDRGHDWLDKFIVHSRKCILDHMKNLKGPVRD